MKEQIAADQIRAEERNGRWRCVWEVGVGGGSIDGSLTAIKPIAAFH